jgi:hypothetical protein
MTDNISRRDAKEAMIALVLGILKPQVRSIWIREIEAALDKLPALDADGRDFDFRVGQPVPKVTGDYHLDGIVRAALINGMLLIYRPANLVSRDQLTSGDAAQPGE